MWNAVLSIASFLGIRKRDDELNEPVVAAPNRKRPRREDAGRRETDDDADGDADAAAFLSRDTQRSVNRPTSTAGSWERAPPQSSLHLVQFAPGVAPASTTPRYMWQDGRYKLVTPPRAKKQSTAAAAAVQPSARSLLQSLAIISQQPQRSAHAGPFSLYSRPRPARRRAVSPRKQQQQRQQQQQQQYRELEPRATWLTPPSPGRSQQQQQYRQNSLFGGSLAADWQDQKSAAAAAAASVAKHAELKLQQEQLQQQQQQQQQQISTAVEAAAALRAAAVSTGAAADDAVDLVSSSDDAPSRSMQPGALSTAAVVAGAAATAVADGAAYRYGDGYYSSSSSSGSGSEEESDDAAAAAAAAADVWDEDVEQQFSAEEVTALKAAWSTAADPAEVSTLHSMFNALLQHLLNIRASSSRSSICTTDCAVALLLLVHCRCWQLQVIIVASH
jgi:hypothetical protein